MELLYAIASAFSVLIMLDEICTKSMLTIRERKFGLDGREERKGKTLSSH